MSEEISTRSELEKLLAREPFVSFVIVMCSGDRYEVDRPEELVIGKDAMILAPHRRMGYCTLRSNQISSIEAFESL